MSYPRSTSQNPALVLLKLARRPVERRHSCTVEMIDVVREAFVCRECGATVHLATEEPLPPGWRVMPGAKLGKWIYLCPNCPGVQAGRGRARRP